jgi:hypothetical protein
MKLKLILCLALVLSGMTLPIVAVAQESSGFDSPLTLVHTLITNLFGNQPFSATAQVESYDGNSLTPATISITATVGFCADGEKFRSYSDMANVKSDMFTPDAAAVFKQHGVDRTILITRLDKNMKFLIYPGLRAYVEKPGLLSPDTTMSPLKIVKTFLGHETIDGHPCNKSRVIVIQDDATNLFATVWQASDLQDFPIQIELGDSVNIVARIQFRDVKIGELDPKLFEVPDGYTRYNDIHEMLNGKPAPTKPADTQADVSARVLKSQQDLANQGDRYGEYRMGLRYRDGDGVPADLDKARELLQKSADQGNTDAAAALTKLPKPKKVKSSPPKNSDLDATNFTILSAEFGQGQQATNLTARVVELLNAHPDGFRTDVQTLGFDPMPGKRKQLVIRYEFKGTNFMATLSTPSQISYQTLAKKALK